MTRSFSHATWWLYAFSLIFVLACSGGDSDGTSPSEPLTLDASVGGDGSVTVPVTEETRLEVRIYGVKPILPGEPRRFQAFIVDPDGNEMDVTAEASWSSSDSAIVDFESNEQRTDGWANIPGDAEGSVSVSASYEGLEGVLDSCTYPKDFSPYLQPIRSQLQLECPCELAPPMPYVFWESAFWPGGENKPLRFSELHCKQETSIIIVMLGTNWCSACTSFMQRVVGLSDELEAAGAEIVFMEIEDYAHEECTSEEAQDHITRHIGEEVGYRVGDADSRPGSGNYFTNAGLVSSYPTVAIIRRRDMRVIADNSTGAGALDLVQVALDPERDWTVPVTPEVRDNCAGQEETSEPNNDPDQKASLAVGALEGGVCDAEPDYFQIDVTGAWRLELAFENSVGDLDMVLWDAENQEALRGSDGLVLGAYTTESTEVFEYVGPALLRVYGFNYASAPYTLTLSQLD